jgi:hypothetical protein
MTQTLYIFELNKIKADVRKKYVEHIGRKERKRYVGIIWGKKTESLK